MGRFMKGIGLKINNMDKVKSNGLMDLHMKGLMLKERRKAKVSSHGLMDHTMRGSFMTT